MAKLDFENFSFKVKENDIIITYGIRYEFTESISTFTDIDPEVIISEKSINFPNIGEKTANNKFNRILDKGLINLKHKINGKKVLYIDEESQIPLIGSGEFGVVDRNTSIIEVKPLTGCNFSCTYCSVSEGINNKIQDVLIDPYYLAKVCGEISSTKKHPVEFNIGPNGEPLLYPFMIDLIKELKNQPNVKVVSINTNGSLLTKELIDQLYKAGLSRLNISLNTLDQDSLDKMKGSKYNLKHILEMIEYCKEKEYPILIAPLIVPTFNDEVEKDYRPLIKLAKTIKSPYPTIGFQKFLMYKGGRNPIKQEQSFESFFAQLKPLEDEYNIILTPKKDYNPFGIYEDKTLEKPMHKNQKIKAEIIGPGRSKNEVLCKANNRIITVRGLTKYKGSVSIRLIRDKHNIFLAIEA